MSDINGLIIKNNNEDLCSICLESVDYDLKIITHYKHYLHEKCLQIYVIKSKKNCHLFVQFVMMKNILLMKDIFFQIVIL